MCSTKANQILSDEQLDSIAGEFVNIIMQSEDLNLNDAQIKKMASELMPTAEV